MADEPLDRRRCKLSTGPVDERQRGGAVLVTDRDVMVAIGRPQQGQMVLHLRCLAGGRVDGPRAGAGRVEEQGAVINPEDADGATVVQELGLAEGGFVLEAGARIAYA